MSATNFWLRRSREIDKPARGAHPTFKTFCVVLCVFFSSSCVCVCVSVCECVFTCFVFRALCLQDFGICKTMKLMCLGNLGTSDIKLGSVAVLVSCLGRHCMAAGALPKC